MLDSTLMLISGFTRSAKARRLIAVFIAGTAVVVACIYLLRGRSESNESVAIRRLVDAVPTTGRTIEPRLAGGFRWAPLRPARVWRGGPREPRDTALADATRDLLRSRSDSLPSHHAIAVALLLMGNAEKASIALREATKATPNAAVWSDLAAAQYATAMASSEPAVLIDSLVSAETALAMAPALPEARFNRALIVERLGLTELATFAWQRYLEVDGTTQWAAEARTHLRSLTSKRPQFRDELTRNYDRIATEPDLARDLDSRFPQEVRTWGETEILGRWAESVNRGDLSAAVKHLAVARSFGQLALARGDALLATAVAAVDRAGPDDRVALVEGHRAFRQAQRVFMQMKPGEAGPIFTDAARSFDRGHSPVADLARYFHANTEFEQQHTEDSAVALVRLLETTPRDFRSARAQIQWELGLCRASQGRYGEALTAVTDGMDTFDAIGEANHAATMREILAWIHELIGDLPTAWHMRLAALPVIGRTNTQIAQATLSSIAQTAILRREWSVATSFLNLELDAAQHAQNHTFVADALLRRALVRHHIHEQEGAAREDLAQARIATAAIADSGMRSQVEGRLWWVEGVLAASPAGKIAALDLAIDFHVKNVRRMNLPELLYERAQAYRETGNSKAAARDLEAAVGELESHRASLPRGDARWGIFHAAEDIFGEAIDLALADGEEETAFRYSERARAQTLLEALRPTPNSPASLSGTAVVVEFAALPSRLVIFIADHSGSRAVSYPVRHSDLQQRVDLFQRAMEAGDTKAIRETGRVLYTALIEPAAHSIPANVPIVVVPDQTLGSLPFAALVGPEGRYLIEDHPIVVTPSVSVYARITARRSNTTRGTTLVVVNSDAPGRKRLPEALAEARRIARMYTGTTVLSGREATAEAFEHEAQRANLIHFSGHALTSEQWPEDTFLVLADAAGQERRLDVRRIAAMTLERAPIVVLAACSSARGRTTPLEGTMSIARAFLAAGARSVIATLWPVEDQEAAPFFIAVHAHLLRGEDPANAVRSAQIESIHSCVSPSLWAAVQVNGS